MAEIWKRMRFNGTAWVRITYEMTIERSGLLDEVHVNDWQPDGPACKDEHCDRVLRSICSAHKGTFGCRVHVVPSTGFVTGRSTV